MAKIVASVSMWLRSELLLLLNKMRITFDDNDCLIGKGLSALPALLVYYS